MVPSGAMSSEANWLGVSSLGEPPAKRTVPAG